MSSVRTGSDRHTVGMNFATLKPRSRGLTSADPGCHGPGAMPRLLASAWVPVRAPDMDAWQHPRHQRPNLRGSQIARLAGAWTTHQDARTNQAAAGGTGGDSVERRQAGHGGLPAVRPTHSAVAARCPSPRAQITWRGSNRLASSDLPPPDSCPVDRDRTGARVPPCGGAAAASRACEVPGLGSAKAGRLLRAHPQEPEAEESIKGFGRPQAPNPGLTLSPAASPPTAWCSAAYASPAS